MGSDCSKYENYIEDTSNIVDPIDTLEVNMDKYENLVLSFCKEFEKNINLLSTMTLQNFLILLNNFNCKNDQTELVMQNFSIKKNKSKGVDINFKEKMATLEKVLDESDFKTFMNKKIINNPLLNSENEIEEKHSFIFQKFLSTIFWNFQQYLFKFKRNDDFNYLQVPKYMVATIGFNFCKVQRSQKVLALFNIMANEEKIVKSNYRNNAFLASYLKNAAISGVNFLLEETEIHKEAKNEDINKLLGGSANHKKLTDNFAIKNAKEENLSIIYKFTNKKNNKPSEIEIGQIFDFFVLDSLKLIFGSACKRELTKEKFEAFFRHEGEGGGFWMLFNEGIRKRFELFIEHQV